MRILLAAAHSDEIAGFTKKYAGIEVLITGIGVPASLFSLHEAAKRGTYDCIIQAGFAGSYSTDLPPGSVALVRADCFADVGFEENDRFIPLHESPLVHAAEQSLVPGWLTNEHSLLQESSLPVVNAITVNKVSDSKLQYRQMVDTYSPALESMEGACLHLTGNRLGIPYLQLRSISNFAGVRNKSEWDFPSAVSALGRSLGELVEQILSRETG